MKKIAIYPGTFDPITCGHLDILKRARTLFEKIIIAVNEDSPKESLFTVQERVELIKEVVKEYPGVEVESFRGLLVRYAERKGAHFIIRGLRAISDFEYEFQLNLMNRNLNPRIEIIYLMTSPEYSFLSSSIIKEVSRLQGEVSGLVPPPVLKKLKEKFNHLRR